MTATIEELLNSKPAAQPVTKAEPSVQSEPEPVAEPAPAPEKVDEPEAAPVVATGDATPVKPADGKDAPPASRDEKPDDLPAQVKAFKRKSEDETRKRQELERKTEEDRRRFAEVERQNMMLQQLLAQFMGPQMAQHQQAQQQHGHAPAQGHPEFLDPEAVRYAEQLVVRERQALEQRFAEQLAAKDYDQRADWSREHMLSTQKDYEEMEQVFVSVAKSLQASGDNSLHDAIRQHPNPARFAYETGKRLKVMQALGDNPEAYIEQEVARRLAEKSAAPPVVSPQAVRVPAQPATPPPKSLAGVPSAAPRNTRKVYEGPTPLEELLK